MGGSRRSLVAPILNPSGFGNPNVFAYRVLKLVQDLYDSFFLMTVCKCSTITVLLCFNKCIVTYKPFIANLLVVFLQLASLVLISQHVCIVAPKSLSAKLCVVKIQRCMEEG